jgi:hypothetical protein
MTANYILNANPYIEWRFIETVSAETTGCFPQFHGLGPGIRGENHQFAGA